MNYLMFGGRPKGRNEKRAIQKAEWNFYKLQGGEGATLPPEQPPTIQPLNNPPPLDEG